MMQVGELYAKLGWDQRDFDAGIAGAEARARTFGGHLSSIFQTAAAAAAQAAAGMAIALTTGIGALGVASVRTAAEFEQAMQQVRAISGATGSDFETLRALAQQMGATTAFTAAQAAEGMTYLAMAGWNTTQIVAGLPSVLALASASQMELGRAADIVSNIMSAYSMSADEAQRATDVLTKASATANTNVAQLGEALKYAGPVAAGLGLDLEDTVAALAKMADYGIQGSLSGTYLRSILSSLASPTKGAAQALDELGIAVFDAHGNMRPLAELVPEFAAATSQLTNEQKLQALTTIFGTEAAGAFLTLLNESGKNLNEYTNTLRQSAGTTAQMAETLLDSFQGRLTLLSSAFDGVKLAIGEQLLPVLSSAVEHITAMLTDLTPVAGRVAGEVAATLRNAGDTLMAWAGTIAAFWAQHGDQIVSSAQRAWGQIQTTVSGVIAAVAAIVQSVAGALAAFWAQHGDQIVSSAQRAWEQIRTTVSGVITAVAAIVQSVASALAAFWSQHGDQIVSSAQRAWEQIRTTVSGVITAVAAIVQSVASALAAFWAQHGNQIVATTTSIWAQIQSIISGAMQLVAAVITAAMQLINATIVPAFQAIAQFISSNQSEIVSVLRNAWDAISSVIRAALTLIQTIITTVLAALRGDWQGAWDALRLGTIATVQALWQGIQSAFQVGQTVIGGIVSGIVAQLGSAWEQARNAATAAFQQLVAAVQAQLQALMAAISGLPGQLASAGASVGRSFVDGIVQQARAGVGAIRQAAWDAAMALLQSAKDALGIRSPAARIRREVVENVNDTIVTGLRNNIGAIRRAMSDVMGEITIQRGAATASATNVTNYYLTAHYAYQSERSLRDDITLLQLLGTG